MIYTVPLSLLRVLDEIVNDALYHAIMAEDIDTMMQVEFDSGEPTEDFGLIALKRIMDSKRCLRLMTMCDTVEIVKRVNAAIDEMDTSSAEAEAEESYAEMRQDADWGK